MHSGWKLLGHLSPPYICLLDASSKDQMYDKNKTSIRIISKQQNALGSSVGAELHVQQVQALNKRICSDTDMSR